MTGRATRGERAKAQAMSTGQLQRRRFPSIPDLGSRCIVAFRRRTDSVSWTLLRVRKDAREPAAPESRIVSAPPPPEADVTPEVAAAALKPALAGLRGEVTLALPADHALLRIFDLPTGDATELPGMVELQVDRFSPFPIDHLVVAHEVLQSTSDRTRVLIAAVRRDIVDREAAILIAAGLDVRRVDLDVLGWWRHLCDIGIREETGLRLHLHLDPAALTVLALQDGHPVLIRALGRGIGTDTPQDIHEEINQTLTTLETEWGLGARASLVVWFEGLADMEWARNLETACGLPVRAATLADLPPLTEGIARRALEETNRTLNLAPPEWESARKSRNATRRIITAAAACVGVWLLAVVVFLGALRLRDGSRARLDIHVKVLEKPAGEVRTLQSRIRALEQYADRTRSALELLRQVSADLPGELTLTSFAFRKGKTLSLRGEADAVNAVYDFFAAMEKSGLYTEVKPEGVTSKPAGGRSRAEFRVSGTLPGGEGAP